MPITEQCHCRPVEAYGISKLAMSLAALDYARTCEMKIIVVRPFNLIGAGLPASLLVGAILQRAKQALSANHDPTISVGNLDSARDFIAIEDAVDAYVRLMKAEAWGEVFNVCSGQARSVRCVIETLLSFAPRPIRAVTDPALMRAVDAPVVVGSCEKARRTCGFQPAVNLDDALRSAWNHVMRQ
jgi:GDP-4-dehydro-6-deoxy-D-mannose reductase